MGGGWEFSNNNLEPGDDNKTLNSLNKRGKDQDEPLFIAALDLAYAFDNGLTLFGGMLRAKESRPTFGVRYDLDKFGEIELSGFYDLPRDVWKDPYLVGQDRDKTFESSYGGAMAYEISGCSLSYELKFLDVDKDLIGKRFSSLKRDGAVHLIETGYEIEIGYGLELSPGLELTIADIDGSSNAYTGFGGGLEIMKRWSDVGFSLSFSVVNNNYNAEHPVFHKKRNEMVYEAMALISWNDPLGMENYSINLGCRFEHNDANIKYFDFAEYVPFLLIGYHFGGSDRVRRPILEKHDAAGRGT